MRNSLKKLLFVVLTVFSVIFIGACGKSKIDKKEVIERAVCSFASIMCALSISKGEYCCI